MTSVFSWQNSTSLCLASFCTPRPNLPVTPGEVKEESEKGGLKLNIQKTKITTSGTITSWQIDGETVEIATVFSRAPKSLQMVTVAMKLRNACSFEKAQPRQHIKKQRHYFANKGPSSQSYGFSSGHVWM